MVELLEMDPGLCVNAGDTAEAIKWPEIPELDDLHPTYLRSVVYNFDTLEAAIRNRTPADVKVIALLNSDRDGFENDATFHNLAEWEQRVSDFAVRFGIEASEIGGRVVAVECLNEWDLRGVPWQTAAACARIAAPILTNAGIKCLLGSVTGSDWPNQLRLAIQELDEQHVDGVVGVCYHSYARTAQGFPEIPDRPAGELDAGVRHAFEVSSRPVWLTEFGIDLDQGGRGFAVQHGITWEDLSQDEQRQLGERGQAEYLRLAYQSLHALPSEIQFEAACWFCWRDDIGMPGQDGMFGKGLRETGGRKRVSWDAYRASA
jgi:hypothetical protein